MHIYFGRGAKTPSSNENRIDLFSYRVKEDVWNIVTVAQV
jgi:hypothetical protein